METILKDKKTIALFMGYKFDKYNNLLSKEKPNVPICGIKDLNYDKDWNAIIPVIEQFEKLELTAYKNMFAPNNHSVKLSLMQPKHNKYNILKTFRNVVNGIEWFLYFKKLNRKNVI